MEDELLVGPNTFSQPRDFDLLQVRMTSRLERSICNKLHLTHMSKLWKFSLCKTKKHSQKFESVQFPNQNAKHDMANKKSVEIENPSDRATRKCLSV